MSSGMIAGRYARALLALAARADQIEEVAVGLDDLAELIAGSPRFAQVLVSPEVPQAEREAVIAEVLKRTRPPRLVDTFVRYVTHKRRIGLITEVCTVYHRLADQRLGRAQAEVTVAAPLGDGDEERLRRLYEKISGKRITLTVKVDPSILGGAVTRIGSTVWDGSLRNALHTIQTEISHG